MQRIPEQEAIRPLADARRFNQVMGARYIQREYQKLAHDVLAMGVPMGGQVLDVGTGSGYVAIQVAGLLQGKAQVVGLDLSESMLRLAAENAAGRGLAAAITWRVGDARQMPFPGAEFDFVVSSGSLHHWDDPAAVFREIARVLKPGGKCLARDSKRLTQAAPRLLAWAIGLSIPPDFRKHYWGSIQASYTRSELEVILRRSGLQNWRVEEDVMDLMVKVSS